MYYRTLLITYDLCKPGRNYESLHKAIKEAPGWAKLLESAWLIRTPQDSAYWRDKLKLHIDANDGLAVIAVSSSWATIGISADVVNWMRQHI